MVHAMVSKGDGSATSDPLSYELRRLSHLVARHAASADEPAPTSAPELPPGTLAVRLADLFGLRGIDVDLALTVLGAELDHDFAALTEKNEADLRSYGP